MTGKEHQPHHERPLAEPLYPSALPPELADFLRGRTYGSVFQATDQGTILVVKAPALDIQSVRGRVPIALRYELYADQAAPVIRTVLRIYDQPTRPLALETFTNVEDPAQRADFAALANQDELFMFFYDEQLCHRLSKGVANPDRAIITQIVGQADELLAAIPRERFDFDRAKAAVMEQYTL